MNRNKLFVTLIALCAMALCVGMTTIVSADDGTTSTTATGDGTTTTSDGSSTTEGGSTTTVVESTTTTENVEWWMFTTIDISSSGLVPSSISVGEKRIAWTGVTRGGFSSIYIWDILNETNTEVEQLLPGNYYNPASDGSLVVYQGARAGAYDDIFVYDTNNGVVRQLTHNSDPGDYNDWNPRIDDGRIVWEKDMLGPTAKPGIYLYDMNKGKLSCVLAGDEYHTPDVGGDYIAANKSSASGLASEIVLYNIKTQETKTISPADTNNERPRLDGRYVIWSSGDIPESTLYYPWETYQILVYDITTGKTARLTDNKAGNFNPSIHGGDVAWEQVEPAGMGWANFETFYRGVWSEGTTFKLPEFDQDGFVFIVDNSLCYAWPEENGQLFTDVGDENAYETSINAIANKHIIDGFEDGYFRTNEPVTRQQYAKMILLTMAAWQPLVYTPSLRDTCTFADAASIEKVDGELYPYHYVAKAARTGLTFGYPDGTFRPLNNISRQQVVSMIVRAAGSNLTDPPGNWQGVLSYVDPEHGERIRKAEFNGLLTGIVGGTQGGLYGWDTRQNATRGEVAQMLYNLLRILGVITD